MLFLCPFLCHLLCASFLLAAGDVECPVVVQEPRGAELDDYLSRLERLGFSGNVLVAHQGEVLLAKGYGLAVREPPTPATPGTIVSMGSITKHFTAAAILKLEMDELLSVEDPIEYFFDDVPADKVDVTVHQLLCHSSGLASSAGFQNAPASLDEYVRGCLQSELLFEPGSSFNYSNQGYGLLACIIEVVTETPYEEFLRDELFHPAGMHFTGYALPEWKAGSIAHGYVDGRSTGAMVGSLGLNAGMRRTLAGSGGLHTQVYDMLRWNQALDSFTVLSEEAQAKMTTPHSALGRAGFGYGYGCGVRVTDRGTRRIGHNGSNDVFSADFRRYPEDRAFIYGAGNNADVYIFDVTPHLEKLLFGEEVTWPPQTVVLPAAELARRAGTWRLEGGTVEVRAQGGGLHLSSADAAAAALLFPVPSNLVTRQRRLLREVPAAFRQAAEGDFAEAHRLLDPFSPRERFARFQGERLAEFAGRYGPLKEVRATVGRSRFDEVAVIVILEHQRGTPMVEYCFGETEVGSIRFLDEFPTRVVVPESARRFVAYHAEEQTSWHVTFGEDGDGEFLALTDGEGHQHRARRLAGR